MKIVSKEIEIITMFDSAGNIKPIRFRYLDGSYQVIKIDRIVEVTKNTFAGESSILYKCQATVNDCIKVFELKYEKRTCKWYLYKI